MGFLIPSRDARSGDDPIFALNAEARKRALAGEPVINATVGALLDDEGKLAVLPGVAEALRAVPTGVAAGYAPIAGPDDFLRAVLANLFGDRTTSGWATAAATPGGTGALRLAVTSFLEPGQALLTSSFYWGPYQTIADESERRLETFRMFDGQGRLDVADFAKQLARQREAQGRALVFLNSPCHNPTGYSFDDDEQKAIAEVVAREAAKCAVAVVLDVAYARYGASDPRRFMDRLVDLGGAALVLLAWSASKAFTAYGQRVGALVAVHPEAFERLQIKNAFAYGCRGTWSNCNASGMAAVTRVLSGPSSAPASIRSAPPSRPSSTAASRAGTSSPARPGSRTPATAAASSPPSSARIRTPPAPASRPRASSSSRSPARSASPSAPSPRGKSPASSTQWPARSRSWLFTVDVTSAHGDLREGTPGVSPVTGAAPVRARARTLDRGGSRPDDRGSGHRADARCSLRIPGPELRKLRARAENGDTRSPL